jgi:hypothetical protein
MIEMDSIEINESEIHLLTTEGYKGANANKITSKGEGIGMFIIQQLLHLIRGRITIQCNIKKRRVYSNGVNYCRNLFIVEIPQHDPFA